MNFSSAVKEKIYRLIDSPPPPSQWTQYSDKWCDTVTFLFLGSWLTVILYHSGIYEAGSLGPLTLASPSVTNIILYHSPPQLGSQQEQLIFNLYQIPGLSQQLHLSSTSVSLRMFSNNHKINLFITMLKQSTSVNIPNKICLHRYDEIIYHSNARTNIMMCPYRLNTSQSSFPVIGSIHAIIWINSSDWTE